MYNGAINYAYSFLPTPVDPTAKRVKKPDLPLFFGNQRRLEENTEYEGEAAAEGDGTETVATTEEEGSSNSTNQGEDEFGETIYPDPILDPQLVQYGGFLIYLVGIMYSFLGISLITQNYINPAIDTIKKKGIIKPDTMNATLLAFSNSAAESFIVINSIFFGVSDIGIQTAVQ